MRHLKIILLIAGYWLLIGLPADGQSIASKCDPSLGLAKMEHQPPKGRLQDAGSLQAQNIVRLNKKAIPLLIGCLTDETKTKEPVEDYWGLTTVGDAAFLFLCDLFTDSSWQHSTIDGVVNWTTLEAEYPHAPSAYAWYSYVRKHGRKYVQNVWYKRWKEEEQAIFWDEKEQCFKIGPHAAQQKNQH
jgi:hypothetical protein